MTKATYNRVTALAACAMAVVCTTRVAIAQELSVESAEVADDGPPDNAVMLGITPLNFGPAFGRHRDNPDSKIDRTMLAAIGPTLEYQRHIGDYVRLGPRLEFLHSFSDRAPTLQELRAVLAASLVWPLLDGDLELSAGIEGGLSVAIAHAEDPPEASGDTSVAPGFTVGGLFGGRGWVHENIAVNLDVAAGLSLAPENGDGFGLDMLRVAKTTLGVVYGW